jgi:hypothetical protein
MLNVPVTTAGMPFSVPGALNGSETDASLGFAASGDTCVAANAVVNATSNSAVPILCFI